MAKVGRRVVLIGTTNKGDLVRIEISGKKGIVTRIGDSGKDVIDADEEAEGKGDAGTQWNVGWTGITFGPDGVLYTLSRTGVDPRADGCAPSGPNSQSTACSRLYSVNPETASIIADHGVFRSTAANDQGSTYVSDVDFDGTAFGVNRFKLSGGAFGLITVQTDGTLLFDRHDTEFGDPGIGRTVDNGGLSFDATTCTWWGVDNGFSVPPALFKIDPATGIASNGVLLQNEINFGFSGLEITRSGRVFFSRSFEEFQIYELVNRKSGRIRQITLDTDATIQGKLNGLEELVASPKPPNCDEPPKSGKSDKSDKSDKSGKSGKSGKSKKSGK